jgi:hypothetical protein
LKQIGVLFLLVFFLGGCAPLCSQFEAQPQKVPVPPDQLAFERAFGTFQHAAQLSALEDFISVYPDSVWASRARSVVLCAQDVALQKERLKGQEDIISEQIAKIRQLRHENARLVETIEQLKSSLIEIEKRPL